MAFTGNNQTIFNAALDGAMAGTLSGRSISDLTQADYNVYAQAALALATEVDANIATDPNLSTGAGGTTIAPVAGVTTATLNAKGHLAFALSFAVTEGRPLQDITAADYSVLGQAVAKAYAAAVAQYANAPGGTSLT